MRSQQPPNGRLKQLQQDGYCVIEGVADERILEQWVETLTPSTILVLHR
jgi:hypothetical protein